MRPGFTMVELLFVLLIAGILGTMAYPAFGQYLQRRNVINAQNAFSLAASRARASAIERGDVVLLWADPASDQVLVLGADGADTLMMLDMRRGQSDIVADLILGSALTICYVPRGFAHPACGDGSELPVAVGFANSADTMRSVINAVGQVEKQ